MSSSPPYRKAPIWRQTSLNNQKIPKHYLSWLLDKGSLTQKLIEKSGGDFHVELVEQRIQHIPLSERKALKIPPRRWAVIREVILYGQHTPWVYARTVIPLSTLKGSLRRLHYLGNKPLGEQLFSNPTMRREPVEVAQLYTEQLPPALSTLPTAWARRSVFRLSNKPLLVSEIFLPAIIQSKRTSRKSHEKV